jgi:hypothetical protein
MRSTGRARQMLILALILAPSLRAQVSVMQKILAQNFEEQNPVARNFVEQNSNEERINEQKKAVVFIFGAIHPLNPDKTALMDDKGNRVVVELPLGTGFLVGYQEQRAGSNYQFSYLVTAKHVLQDTDGSFLPRVRIRLNLKSPTQDSGVGFISDIPVTDARGILLWFQGEDAAEDAVVLPLFPDKREFDFETIPMGMFLNDRDLNDRGLNSGAVAEGDDLYFIGLMEQYYGIKRNYPLVRRGALALLTDEYIDTPTGPQKVIIAELESWPGNSGSPVFLLGNLRDASRTGANTASLLGMIVGSFRNRFSVPLDGPPSTRRLEAGDAANIGMTSIVAASVIEQILDSSPAQEERDARMRRLRGLGGVEATSH